MDRIMMITTSDDLDADARSVHDRIVESRGEVSRPFQMLLHVPPMARAVAELGHVVRFGSHLADADRELVTLATGRALGCRVVWESHLAGAIGAGVTPGAIAALQGDRRGLDERGRALVAFVDELSGTNTVSDRSFGVVHELLDTPGTVELAVTIGYYTMLGRVMGAGRAC